MLRNIALIFVIFQLFSTTLFAQTDPKAKSLLDKMSAKYKELKSFKAEFKYTLTNNAEGKSDNFQGTITVKKDKYRISIGEQEIYNNTKTVWTHLKDAGEVQVSNYQPDPEDALQTPTQIFTLYEKGFKYLYLGNKTIDGKVYEIVDLAPENPKAKKTSFFKIQLLIDKKDFSLRSWDIYENGNANKYSFVLKNFQANFPVEDTYFNFDTKAFPKVEVVDLR
jgi:outer membrane lipoprotein-sorting protein